MNKINETIEKLLGKLSPASYYKSPFLYHGNFYTIKGFEIIMGGMVMEITLKRVGVFKYQWMRTTFKEKKIIDDDVVDIIFLPEKSIILFNEKKQK
jgi:hypothetical protein